MLFSFSLKLTAYCLPLTGAEANCCCCLWDQSCQSKIENIQNFHFFTFSTLVLYWRKQAVGTNHIESQGEQKKKREIFFPFAPTPVALEVHRRWRWRNQCFSTLFGSEITQRAGNMLCIWLPQDQVNLLRCFWPKFSVDAEKTKPLSKHLSDSCTNKVYEFRGKTSCGSAATKKKKIKICMLKRQTKVKHWLGTDSSVLTVSRMTTITSDCVIRPSQSQGTAMFRSSSLERKLSIHHPSTTD